MLHFKGTGSPDGLSYGWHVWIGLGLNKHRAVFEFWSVSRCFHLNKPISSGKCEHKLAYYVSGALYWQSFSLEFYMLGNKMVFFPRFINWKQIHNNRVKVSRCLSRLWGERWQSMLCYQKQVRCTQKSFVTKILQKVNQFLFRYCALNNVIHLFLDLWKKNIGIYKILT